MTVNRQHSRDCQALVGGTEETINLDFSNWLQISNAINDKVYIFFDWIQGEDSEVSATNYDVVLDAYDTYLYERKHSSPRFENMRVVCATGGSIGIMGW